MKNQKLARIEKEIKRIKMALFELGDMRPGSLSRQMRHAKERYGSYWQLSYTYRGKGHTEYIKKSAVAQLKTEVTTYRRHRKLTDNLLKLSIERSRLKMKLESKNNPK